MQLGLINSAWVQANQPTVYGLRKTKELGVDTVDIFVDPLEIDIQERRLIKDDFDRAFQRSVDRRIIGRDFDGRRQAGTDEGDITRADPRFDHQLIFERHDLHQGPARRDDAADGRHFQVLDDPAHGRGQQGPCQLVFAPLDDFQRLIEIGLVLGIVGIGVDHELVLQRIQLGLQLVFLPLMAELTERFGWRANVLFVCGMILVAALIVLAFMRDRPSDLNLPSYGEVNVTPPPPTGAGLGSLLTTPITVLP